VWAFSYERVTSAQQPFHLGENVLGGALEEDRETLLPPDVVAAPHHPPHVAVRQQHPRGAPQAVQEHLQKSTSPST
jgi:hypothetical protein